MRNLKKFLALVLAFVMAMSLMTTVSAKNVEFANDGEKINDTFIEDITVLAGMGVIKGVTKDEFQPQENVTRAEMAAIVYRLATGDASDSHAGLYANDDFKDVASDKWYAGYVGFCSNAQLIVGYGDGTFRPSDYVTGYEMLVMLLRAMGYTQPGEFSGSDWRVRAAKYATERGLLTKVNTTRYQGTLSDYAKREVVAEVAFQAAHPDHPTVQWTDSLGYQDHKLSGILSEGSGENDSLGEMHYGLARTTSILIGNQDTGETRTVLGTVGKSSVTATGGDADGEKDFDAYHFNGTVIDDTQTAKAVVTGNETYKIETSLDLIGHNVEMWYGTGNVGYAVFDRAIDTKVVKATANSELDDTTTADQLGKVAADAGFVVDTDNGAYFNNSFGTFTAARENDGTTASPVDLYVLISNTENVVNGKPNLDAVIALNIETSQITESTATRGVPTVGVPVSNAGTPDFIDDTGNVTDVNNVETGVIAQDALTSNSTKALYDYEMGIHITGTTPREPGTAEKIAVKTGNTASTDVETAYFMLNKVTATVTGTVVNYNISKGTVTVKTDSGETVTLNRSIFYDTVVLTNTPSDTVMPVFALPQSVAPKTNLVGGESGLELYEESYNYSRYEFYTDYEGNYLGAARKYDNGFFYGTYVDYEQKLSSSTFTYYLTGVDFDGKVDTRIVTDRYEWEPTQADRTAGDPNNNLLAITATNDLGVPYRASGYNGQLAQGMYIGYTISDGLVDPNLKANVINQTDYFMNMERLGVERGLTAGDTFAEPGSTNKMYAKININEDALGLGVVETETNSKLYLTEQTKFILVNGFGTDTLKPEIYTGITALVQAHGDGKSATINLSEDDKVPADTLGLLAETPYAAMTYYTKSPMTFAQTGDTAEKVDAVILPFDAVEWGTSAEKGMYFMGDPTWSLRDSHKGETIYQYTVYDLEGNEHQVWLDKAPTAVYNDSFVELTPSGDKANNGEDIYRATFKANIGVYATFDGSNGGVYIDGENAVVGSTIAKPASTVTYNSTTTIGSAVTAIFTWSGGSDKVQLRVDDANVTNLNAENSPAIGTGTGYIWPGITDLTSLNNAGSINPVNGNTVKVAAVVDGYQVTQIFVCWDQNDA